MKNPGSLSGDGSNLRRDTTLRILRVIGDAVGCSHLVVNLFDYASPKIANLYENWSLRDGSDLVYSKLDLRSYGAVVFAHGDLHPAHISEYTERISLVRDAFRSLPSIAVPLTRKSNPVHPMNWQRNSHMLGVIEAIRRRF